MMIQYVAADPTGNITVLIRSPYTAETRQAMIREAFEKVPSCEQAGFISSVSPSLIRLEMMGYEFCGNATLSAAAYQAYLNGMAPGHSGVINVASSGVDRPVPVEIRCLGESEYSGTLEMPCPRHDQYRGFAAVHLEGISHLLIPEGTFSDEEAVSLISEYAEELGVPALGMIFWSGHGESGSDDLLQGESVRIRPLVYVRGSDTVVWEHGCASGSIAAGYYRWTADKSIAHRDVVQPGGVISIRFRDGGMYLTGKVRLLQV